LGTSAAGLKTGLKGKIEEFSEILSPLKERTGRGISFEIIGVSGKKGGVKGGAVMGKRHYEEGTGIFSLSPEEKLEICSMGGKKTKELGLGIYGLTPEQKSENGKKGGTISSTQKWMCLETGYITTSGPLTLYQRKRGIDTSKRVRIS
jgi:general stress protein YciG